MKVFITEIRAVCVEDGITRLYAGPKIPANSLEEAKEYCRIHLPFCKVYGRLSLEAPIDDYGGPDWGKAIDYDKMDLN